MKIRIIASAFLIVFLSLTFISDVNAQHGRGGRGWHGGWHHGWYGPRIGVGVWAPPVVVGGYYGPYYDGYYGPSYYYGPRYYRGYGHPYRRGYYGHRYYGGRGHYGHRR